MLWIFSPEKSDGFGRVQTWVPEASMLTTRPLKALSSDNQCKIQLSLQAAVLHTVQ
jgi:hypothetical protein